MPMTQDQLAETLRSEEPQYEELAARLDEGDLPALRAIAAGDELGIATKAIYLASLLEGEAAKGIVIEAAESGEELKRIAAGSAMANLPAPEAEQVALRLIDEANPALTKLVLREVRDPSPELAEKMRAVSERRHTPEALRTMLQEKLRDE